MPTYERRFFLGLLMKSNVERQEQIEAQQEQTKTRGSKGSRTTNVSGNALKNGLKSGKIK